MAVLTVYQHGLKAGVAPEPSNHQRTKRRACQGWTAKATRSNLEFLRSVYIEQLTGLGHCFTLTVRSCPPTAKVWESMRVRFVDRMRTLGMVRLHWVTEWQERGVPHLHGVCYFDEPGQQLVDQYRSVSKWKFCRLCQAAAHSAYIVQDRGIRRAWVEVVAEYGAEMFSQHIKPIGDSLGWLKYLAKHAARGADHYQRSSDNMPEAWQSQTGRMWGKSGEWPTTQPIAFDLGYHGYFEFRRLVQRYRLADARASGDRYRIRAARKMLQSNVRTASEVRGISEWIPLETQLAMLAFVQDLGHAVIQRADPELE